MVKDWGTTYAPHVTLNLVEIGKFNSSMRRNNADSWSRPMIREDQIPAVRFIIKLNNFLQLA